MVRIAYTVVLLVLIAWSLSLVYADKTWEVVWQSPPRIEYMSFADSMNGWVGTPGAFLHTKDGGETWESLPDPPANWVSFVDERNGWSFGEGIHHTEDGGRTWQLQKAGIFHHAYFLDAQKGWVVGSGGSILHTEDGGNTWRPQKSNVTGNLLHIRYSDENHGWIYGMAKPLPDITTVILHTKDGGTTWETMVLGHEVRLMYALDEKHVWIEKNDMGGRWIFFSSDSGKHWEKRAEALDLNAVQFVDKNMGWALGGQYLLKTEDGGETWERRDFPERMYADHYMQFTDEKTGWIGGNGLIHTKDAGETFEIQSPPGTGFQTIFFLNKDVGWAAGDSILQTKDGGTSWGYLNEEVDHTSIFHDLYFSGANQGIGTNDSMVHAIIQTEDGGKNWETQWTDERFSRGKLCFINPQEGWVSGGDKVMHTEDGGMTWEEVAQIDDFRLLDIYFFDENHGCTIGNEGIYYTDDSGRSWDRTLRGSFDSMDNKLYFRTRNEGWAIVSYSLYHTRSGGKDWEEIESESLPSRPSEVLHNLVFIDENEGWVLASASETGGGRLYQTIDGGENWELKESIQRVTSYDTFCYDGVESIYLALAYGTILRYTDESYASRGMRVKGDQGVFPVEEKNMKLTAWGDVKRPVLHQNYPNPFNPETWIPYQLSGSGYTSIDIYDAQGQLVRKLSLANKEAGMYMERGKAAYWDGTNDRGEKAASGLYFYQLKTTEGYSDVKKMVLSQ